IVRCLGGGLLMSNIQRNKPFIDFMDGFQYITMNMGMSLVGKMIQRQVWATAIALPQRINQSVMEWERYLR
ncbi:MAG: hypothetical protein COZ12_07955, partial [Deltaproteobacteria bacterium CG_4_10_14_3_um_filter_60_8]